MNENEKIPIRVDRELTDDNVIVYVLVHRIAGDVYYVCDMHGTLSKCEEDAMMFFDEKTALRYQGMQECLFEKRTGQISRIYLKKIDSRLFVRRVSNAFI